MGAHHAGSRRSPRRDELATWRDYVETGDQLRSMLASRMAAGSDISTGDYSVLLALSEARDTRMRSSQLAVDINWERSRLSHHLGRMEARGLVTRERCDDDHRGFWITLTETGLSTFRRASSPHLHAVQDLFVDALDPQMLANLAEITAALREHLAGRSA